MKCFLPAVFDEVELEDTYAFMREYARRATDFEFFDRRIDSVRFNVGEGSRTISVGEWTHGATVQCIFESDQFYVLLTTSGTGFDQPVLIDRDIVVKVDYFEGFGIQPAA